MRSKPLAILAVSAGCALAAAPAGATPFLIATSGVVASGSDPADLLGAGTSLTGDAYTLTIRYNGLGADYFTDGTFAADFGDLILGSVTLTIAGRTIAVPIVTSAGSSLLQDLNDIQDSDSGFDASGNFVAASQDVSTAGAFLAAADLQTPFSYALTAADFGLDTFTYSNAADTETASFTGAPYSVTSLVPEPAPLALTAAGLLAAAVARRARGARR